MKTFIYPLLLIGCCAFLFAQEQEGIEKSPCVLYPPNTLIKSDFLLDQLISMKMDQENWTTDIFLRGRHDSERYDLAPDICVRVAASGNQIKILAYHHAKCGITTPFHTNKWYVKEDEFIHLFIEIFSSPISLRLLGYETQAVSIPIAVWHEMRLKSSTTMEFMCHKGCPLRYGYNEDIPVTNKPFVILRTESPLNFTMNWMTSHEGMMESRNIDLPFPLKGNTLYEVEVKEAENNKVMITINGGGMLYQVAEEKMFSHEETILEILGGYFYHTLPDCTFKDQKNKDNKDGDGGDDDVGITADDGDEENEEKADLLMPMMMMMMTMTVIIILVLSNLV